METLPTQNVLELLKTQHETKCVDLTKIEKRTKVVS